MAEREIDIEQIEHKRSMNPSVDAVYLLSPEPHIVDCLMADFERRRYRRSYLIWTSCLSCHSVALHHWKHTNVHTL